MVPLKYCARPPIIDGGLQMPVGVGLPHRYPEQLATPFLATAKLQKKNWVLEFDRSTTYFVCQTLQNQAQSATIYRKMEDLLFCAFGVCFFYGLFFALIRVTLGFFVVFTNKSHTLIRVTFGSNESKTIRAT